MTKLTGAPPRHIDVSAQLYVVTVCYGQVKCVEGRLWLVLGLSVVVKKYPKSRHIIAASMWRHAKPSANYTPRAFRSRNRIRRHCF